MPVLRFHLLDLYYSQIEGGFTVTVTTNAACHLYLRYSDVFPHIHRKGVLRRGLVMGWDARYCFVAYHHIEQNEADDTFTHTFTWPGWSNCEKRYFYFWGTMGGQDMVSDTPIFWLHYFEEELPPFVYSPRVDNLTGHALANHAVWNTAYNASGDSSHWWGDLYATEGSWWETLGKFYLARTFFGFDTSQLLAAHTILGAKLRLMVRTGNYDDEATAGYSTVHVVEGIQHAPLVAADFGAHRDKILSGGSLPFSSIDGKGGQYVDIPLNSAGIAWIVKEGITKFCLRLTGEKAGIKPTGLNRVWWHTDDPGKEAELGIQYV